MPSLCPGAFRLISKQRVSLLTAGLIMRQRNQLSKRYRFPVTVNVLEGAFTLELDGRPPITVKAGEAMVEPPNVAMTGY